MMTFPRSEPVRDSADRSGQDAAGEPRIPCPPVLLPIGRTGGSDSGQCVEDCGTKILVSSRDGHPVPAMAGPLKLAGSARAHGWVAETTYALAAIPDEYHLNGNLARAAHHLASVVVRLRRPSALGWAVWHSVDGGSFRFVHAFVNCRRFGWSRAAKIPSILERITQP